MKRAAALLLLSLPLALTTACQQFATAAASRAARAEHVVFAPAAARRANEAAGLKTAIFSGGCFWGVEGVFSHVQGVTSAVTGYHGGSRGDATYEKVSEGTTGHAESVRVTYDPARVRYDQLLQIFFSVIADPTQSNRQGPDVGTQYRSALVPMSEEQRLVAHAYLAQLRASGLWGQSSIVTQVERFRQFYPAEAYHQDFILNNPQQAYIVAWDLPKITALQRLFPQLYKRDYTTG